MGLSMPQKAQSAGAQCEICGKYRLTPVVNGVITKVVGSYLNDREARSHAPRGPEPLGRGGRTGCRSRNSIKRAKTLGK
jgi:hypothetical protein